MTREDLLRNEILHQYKSVREFTIKYDMPYNSVANMFKRGMGGAGVDLMIRICDALQLSLDALAHGEIRHTYEYEVLRSDEVSMLKKYRDCDERGKKHVIESAERELEYLKEMLKSENPNNVSRGGDGHDR